MNPVAIFRHSPVVGPGYFGTFLDSHSIPWQLIKVDANDDLHSSTSQFSGLVFLGCPASVNDDLPWIANDMSLIQQVVAN